MIWPIESPQRGEGLDFWDVNTQRSCRDHCNHCIFKSGADSSFIHVGLLRIPHQNVCNRRWHAHLSRRMLSFFSVLVAHQHGCCLVIVNQDQSPYNQGDWHILLHEDDSNQEVCPKIKANKMDFAGVFLNFHHQPIGFCITPPVSVGFESRCRSC